MSQETVALLRSIYFAMLESKTLTDAMYHIKTMMGKEEASYVEKMYEEKKEHEKNGD